jgi:hypothetical protein
MRMMVSSKRRNLGETMQEGVVDKIVGQQRIKGIQISGRIADTRCPVMH